TGASRTGTPAPASRETEHRDKDRIETGSHQTGEKEMTAATTTITLTCPECRHENEIERIYCHSCGARLDRSALSARKMPKTEAPEEIQKRLQGIFNQLKAWIRYALSK